MEYESKSYGLRASKVSLHAILDILDDELMPLELTTLTVGRIAS